MTTEAGFEERGHQKSIASNRLPSVRDGMAGLALSESRIRSASFDLGVLQALNADGMLRNFDYLSTVSGGDLDRWEFFFWA
jgi:hypothetical protein